MGIRTVMGKDIVSKVLPRHRTKSNLANTSAVVTCATGICYSGVNGFIGCCTLSVSSHKTPTGLKPK